MQPFLPRKESAPDFSDPAIQKAFVEEAQDSKLLMQKELEVNQAEQLLLAKRVQLMKSFLNDIPSSDPQYSMLLLQLSMDQVELDELKVRETLLTQKLSS